VISAGLLAVVSRGIGALASTRLTSMVSISDGGEGAPRRNMGARNRI